MKSMSKRKNEGLSRNFLLRKKIELNSEKFDHFVFCSNSTLESCMALLFVHVEPFKSGIFLRKLEDFLMSKMKEFGWRFLLNFSASGCELCLFVPPDPDAPEGYPIRDAILQLMDYFKVSVYKIGGSEIGEIEI